MLFAAITCHVNPNGESSIGKQISREISLSLSSIHLCSDFFASHAWRTFQETFPATCYKCATQFSQFFLLPWVTLLGQTEQMRPSWENFQPVVPVLGRDLVSEAQCCQCSHTCRSSDTGNMCRGWLLPAHTKCEIFMEASAGSALSTLLPFKQLLCCIFRTQSPALMKTAA